MKKGIDNIINTMKKGAIFYFNPVYGNGEYLKSKGGITVKNMKIVKYIKK